MNEAQLISASMTTTNQLRCWCSEAGKCGCTPECTPNCECIEFYIQSTDPRTIDFGSEPCSCVMFPATQTNAPSYLVNTHDVLRRGAH